MKLIRRSLTLIALVVFFSRPLTSLGQELPSASNLVARVVLRAAQVATNDVPGRYAYDKASLVEELNTKDEVIHATEKTYKVLLVRGIPFSRLTGVRGRQLSDAEIETEDRKEREFLKKVSDRNMSKMAERKEAWITPELVGRYEFTVVEAEFQGQGRTIILEFKPRPDNSEKTIQDRIYNRLAGRIWVDEAEAEIAKLDVHMTEGFSLGWIGLLGSVKEGRLNLQRQRLDGAVWVNAKQTVVIRGRKLFSAMHFRRTDESSGFRAEP